MSRASGPGSRRVGGALALVAVGLTLTTSCTSSSTPRAHRPEPDARQVIRSLGAVPIPSASGALSTPTASPDRPALLAIGEPIHAEVGTTRALVTALGPAQQVTAPAPGATGYPSSTRAVITLRDVSAHGALPLATRGLIVRDETGHVVALRPAGPTSAVARPGHPATIRVLGTFASGAAALTWRVQGRTVAVWTFNIELD